MKRRELLNAGSLVLLLGAHQIARGATIVAVRLWPAPEYTRLTIESDTLLASKQVLLERPAAAGAGHRGPGRSTPPCANWSPR